MPRKYTRHATSNFTPRTPTQTNVGLIAIDMLNSNWNQAMQLLRSHLASSTRVSTGRRGRIGKVTAISTKAAKTA